MKETVMSLQFSDRHFEFDGKGDAVDKEYRARLDLLQENYRNSLLIIDNFDSAAKNIAELQNEPEYKDILGLDMKILFTTRSRPHYATPELNSLSYDDAFSLFQSIIKIPVHERNIVSKLIQEVECHPMTVEILAKTLKDSCGILTTKNLLCRLKNENLNSSQMLQIKHQKQMTERETKIYGHLRTLFNLIYLDKNYRDILCDVTLLPIEGFDAAEFILSESTIKKTN